VNSEASRSPLYGRISGACPERVRKGFRAWRPGRGQPVAAAADDLGRLHDVSRRDLADSAQLGRDELSEPHLLQRGRQGRALRRLGGAGAPRHRGASRIRITALIGARHRRRSAGRRDRVPRCSRSRRARPRCEALVARVL